ncbi:Hypothetical predicted protein [Lecanosticta acicola]|uniref:RNI-like protein n=1 Tax=Lecanosticta acicola TaxID=111012 RepID=A0AAI8Z3Y8_9PEZI|nr:Hypothetical predicted protein [Lecanosticta acicola]
MMDQIHGVDVSWLHHPHRSAKDQKPAPAPAPAPTTATATAHNPHESPSPPAGHDNHGKHSYFPGPVTPPALSQPVSDTITALPSTPTPPANTIAKSQTKRPGLRSRGSSEKLNEEKPRTPRRSSSWISNLSNKFSSTPERGSSVPAQPTPHPSATSPGPSIGGAQRQSSPADAEEAEPYVPSRPKESTSFFSNLTRKLSAGQTPATPKPVGTGGVCERRVLNVDPNRERCLVPELDPSRLRKVAFCVDVEIAGGPRYLDEEDDEQDGKRKKSDVKMKERAEGEALKHPQALKEEKEEHGEVKLEGKNKPLPIPKDIPNGDKLPGTSVKAQDGSPPPNGSLENTSAIDRKKEKKKKSEEERKERKEKRRKKAEENGSIPVEHSLDDDVASERDADAFASSLSNRKPLPTSSNNAQPPITKCDRPTTDPVRIYRRCCQLRETPILKRITEQLMAPTCCVPYEPGVVNCLDLTGSRLQLADMITLGDWLAVVPVKRLLLEDADLNDEGLRCILAGLLAAKRPEPNKRRNTSPKHRERIQPKHYQERAGVVEKITLKNNPRITRMGWKHISLFLYMCRSIKAIDLSLMRFPDTLPPSAHSTHIKSPHHAPTGPGHDADAAETLFRCLSQRLGGDRLEELIVSECNLKSRQIRKIVDAAIICGIHRLGFAGNHLDDEGLESCVHYLKSGVGGGLDIGGNDLRGKLDKIAAALCDRQSGEACWALSLAGCNLDTESIKPLFPVLVTLHDFRFIDLSHNQDLCGKGNGTISLLRRYIGRMKDLKRIHLADVGMSPKQAIALADVLPEGPKLAHLNILENPQLSALASAKDEASQGEACALYASYMAAVRVSNTLICIDIDVPSPDNSEIVKALAKQMVAYSLRNMDRFAIAEETGNGNSATADAAASLAQPHGGEQQLKEITVPDVLMHLVGHVEGNPDNHDNDPPAPDDDYIVGGTGVVKALQYVLGEKADDLRRSSIPNPPTLSGAMSPRERPSSSAGFDAEQQVKAKKMSKNLLDSARKIRARLQPALAKEARGGDEMALRRLVFLDQTLQSMIQRFEEEYPETRLAPPSPKALSLASSGTEHSIPLTINTAATELTNKSDDEDEYEEDGKSHPAFSRHNSDVSLASRALGIEEGHLHRLGQRMRREVVDSPATAFAPDDETPPWKEIEAKRLAILQEQFDSISGQELKTLVEEGGWDAALRKVDANMEDLIALQEQDPHAWNAFLESQMKARMNLRADAKSRAS